MGPRSHFVAFDVESLITLDPAMAKLACNVNHNGTWYAGCRTCLEENEYLLDHSKCIEIFVLMVKVGNLVGWLLRIRIYFY